MDNQYDERAKIITSIHIPRWLCEEIKNSGMTYSGAMVAGWSAMQERKEASQKIYDLKADLEDTRRNMVKYRDRWMELMQEKEGLKNV